MKFEERWDKLQSRLCADHKMNSRDKMLAQLFYNFGVTDAALRVAHIVHEGAKREAAGG